MMSDLVEFLRARLDEDEEVARAAAREMDGESWDAYFIFREGISISTDGPVEERDGYISHHEETSHISRHDPSRVLREVEAKRQILWLYEGGDAYERSVMEAAIEAMAAIYAEHPDCLDKWKPTHRQES